MKRIIDYPVDFLEEVPRDVWSYIINIYHHLKFSDQWRQFQLACISSQKYVLPKEKVEIPLYEGYTTLNACSLFYKIHSLCWNARGVLIGACVDSFDFMPNQPIVELHKRRFRTITVFNGNRKLTRSDYDCKTPWTVVRRYDDEDERLVGILTIPLSAFPSDLFT